MKTYKTRENAVSYANKIVERFVGCGVTYIITAEADGRFAPLFFCDDTQMAIGFAQTNIGRAMQGFVPRYWQNGDIKSF